MSDADKNMSNNLKQGNILSLAAILALTLALMASIELGVDQVIGKVSSLKELGLAAVITVFSGVLANILPANVKHMLVYIGYKYALPGHRCHKICKNDARINYGRLRGLWPIIFSDETDDKDRNALWYSEIYSTVKDRKEVMQSHGYFLLYRDSFAAIIIMFISSITWLFGQYIFELPKISYWLSMFLFFELVIFMQLARTSGNRMVCNAVVTAAN